MPNRSLQTVLFSVSIAIGFGLIFVLSNAMETARPQIPGEFEDEDLYLSSKRMKALSGDFNGLVADWYWINSLQYIGRKIVHGHEAGYASIKDLRPLNPTLLYPMLDRTTTLDPNYRVAYTYGAVVLPAINEADAIRLTEKGIAENPDDWRLYQHLGYIYWNRDDYEKAAEVYENGSKIAGAPPFMKEMSAKVRLEGGSRETARQIYRHIYDDAEDNQTRELMALRLLQIDSLDERDAIRKIIQDQRAKNGRCANSWNDVFNFLRGIKLPNGKGLVFARPNNTPVDPTGVPYLLINADGQCDVDLDKAVSKIPPG